MAELNIKGTTYEARTDFKFQQVADEKYSERDDKGKKVQSGLEVIYANLLEEDILYLSYFWDCALSHLRERPSLSEIQEALIHEAGTDADYEHFFKAAFSKLDNAGFFRKQVKKFWKNLSSARKILKEEMEKEMFEEMFTEMQEARSRLNPSA